MKEHTNSQRRILETLHFLSPLSKLAKSILVLPYTSAPVERVFSQIEDFATPKKSRLTTENLEACLIVQQAQQFEGYDFEITSDMLSKYQTNGYNSEEEVPPHSLQASIASLKVKANQIEIEATENNLNAVQAKPNTSEIIREELTNFF